MTSAAGEDRKPELPEAEKLKIFISYSRQDMAFAKEIVAGLEMLGGFEVSIDTEAIHEGEAWQARLGALVAGADTVVFILTPKSAGSSVCLWEVEEAERLSKRILPVQAASLDGASPPKQLSALNYVRFDPQDDGRPRSFMEGLAGLRRALTTDVGWLREHTRLLVRAREWEGTGRAENRLLSGGDIALAKSWLADRPQGAPAPTELHHDFISTSEKAEEARVLIKRARVKRLQAALDEAEAAKRTAEEAREQQAAASRRVVQSIAAGLVAAVLFAGVAGWFGWRSNLAEHSAKQQAVRADTAAASAQAAEQRAASDRDAARITQSRFLSDLAVQQVSGERADAGTAILLSLAGLPDATRGPNGKALSERIYAEEAERALYTGHLKNRELAVLAGSVFFSPDRARIVTALGDGTVRLWEAATWKALAAIEGDSLAFSPDGARIVTALGDGTVRLWEAATGKALAALEGHKDLVSSATFSPNGARIVTASHDGTARVWEAASGKVVATLEGHKGSVSSAAFSPDGARIVTTSSDKEPRIWDVATGKALAAIEGNSLAFSPDGARIVTTSSDKEPRIWDVATGKVVAMLDGHCSLAATGMYRFDCWADSAAFSPDGARIVTASIDGTARVWEAASGKAVAVLEGGHRGAVETAAFSADGARIVTASSDGTARVWEVATGKAVAVLKGHKSGLFSAIFSAAFSPDGARIVTASADGTARLWEVATGKAVAVLEGHKSFVLSAAFSPDGARIVTASNDKTSRVWRVFPTLQTLVDHSKRAVPRCLTRDQLQRFYLPEEPPRWCITGPGREAETDPAKWEPKWPYHPAAWRDWLAAKNRGESPPLPQE